MEQHTDLQEIIEYLNPAELDYQDWVNVGMALKHEGYSVDVWDTWSKNDRRYHSGECEKKWNTFHGSNSPVTAGTIVQLAMEHGWKPSYTAYELGWDDEISAECLVVDRSWVEGKEIHEPRNWDPVNEITRYLETLFDPYGIWRNYRRCVDRYNSGLCRAERLYMAWTHGNESNRAAGRK